MLKASRIRNQNNMSQEKVYKFLIKKLLKIHKDQPQLKKFVKRKFCMIQT